MVAEKNSSGPPCQEDGGNKQKKQRTAAGEPDPANLPRADPDSEEDILQAVCQPQVQEAARAEKVVWARVKGYPFWPAQVLSDREASKRLKNVRKSKEHSAAVMFFGTLEISWLLDKDMCQWQAGTKEGFHEKGKSRKQFARALEEVCSFLGSNSNRKRKAPEGWWCKPPAPARLKPLKPKRKIITLPSSPSKANPRQKQPSAAVTAADPDHAVPHSEGADADKQAARRAAGNAAGALQVDAKNAAVQLEASGSGAQLPKASKQGMDVTGARPKAVKDTRQVKTVSLAAKLAVKASSKVAKRRQKVVREVVVAARSEEGMRQAGPADPGANPMSDAAALIPSAPGPAAPPEAPSAAGPPPPAAPPPPQQQQPFAPLPPRPPSAEHRAAAPQQQVPPLGTAAGGPPGAQRQRSPLSAAMPHLLSMTPQQLGMVEHLMLPAIQQLQAAHGQGTALLQKGIQHFDSVANAGQNPTQVMQEMQRLAALPAKKRASGRARCPPANGYSSSGVAGSYAEATPSGAPQEPLAPLRPQAETAAARPRPVPPQYEHLRRNVWATTRTRPKRLPKDEIAVCNCKPPRVPGFNPAVAFNGSGDANGAAVPAPDRTGCGEHCLNRLSMITCDLKFCPCGQLCSNRPFHLLKMPKLETFLTKDRGWGIRALEPLPKGTFTVEYIGEIIENEEYRRRMAASKERGEHDFYMMELGPGLIIDARAKGNLARLINSSCSPNCETQKWHDAGTGETRIGIFAAKDIAVGEELTYDYQFEHFGLESAAGAYRCKCGAPQCRGTMDAQPERLRDFGKRVEIYWDGDGVYYRGTVTGYSAAQRKHTVLYDDNDVERVCLDRVAHRWLDEDAPRKLSPALPSPRSMAAGMGPPAAAGRPAGASPASSGGDPVDTKASAAPLPSLPNVGRSQQGTAAELFCAGGFEAKPSLVHTPMPIADVKQSAPLASSGLIKVSASSAMSQSSQPPEAAHYAGPASPQPLLLPAPAASPSTAATSMQPSGNGSGALQPAASASPAHPPSAAVPPTSVSSGLPAASASRKRSPSVSMSRGPELPPLAPSAIRRQFSSASASPELSETLPPPTSPAAPMALGNKPATTASSSLEAAERSSAGSPSGSSPHAAASQAAHAAARLPPSAEAGALPASQSRPASKSASPPAQRPRKKPRRVSLSNLLDLPQMVSAARGAAAEPGARAGSGAGTGRSATPPVSAAVGQLRPAEDLLSGGRGGPVSPRGSASPVPALLPLLYRGAVPGGLGGPRPGRHFGATAAAAAPFAAAPWGGEMAFPAATGMHGPAAQQRLEQMLPLMAAAAGGLSSLLAAGLGQQLPALIPRSALPDRDTGEPLDPSEPPAPTAAADFPAKGPGLLPPGVQLADLLSPARVFAPVESAVTQLPAAAINQPPAAVGPDARPAGIVHPVGGPPPQPGRYPPGVRLADVDPLCEMATPLAKAGEPEPKGRCSTGVGAVNDCVGGAADSAGGLALAGSLSSLGCYEELGSAMTGPEADSAPCGQTVAPADDAEVMSRAFWSAPPGLLSLPQRPGSAAASALVEARSAPSLRSASAAALLSSSYPLAPSTGVPHPAAVPISSSYPFGSSLSTKPSRALEPFPGALGPAACEQPGSQKLSGAGSVRSSEETCGGKADWAAASRAQTGLAPCRAQSLPGPITYGVLQAVAERKARDSTPQPHWMEGTGAELPELVSRSALSTGLAGTARQIAAAAVDSQEQACSSQLRSLPRSEASGGGRGLPAPGRGLAALAAGMYKRKGEEGAAPGVAPLQEPNQQPALTAAPLPVLGATASDGQASSRAALSASDEGAGQAAPMWEARQLPLQASAGTDTGFAKRAGVVCYQASMPEPCSDSEQPGPGVATLGQAGAAALGARHALHEASAKEAGLIASGTPACLDSSRVPRTTAAQVRAGLFASLEGGPTAAASGAWCSRSCSPPAEPAGHGDGFALSSNEYGEDRMES